MQSYGTFLLLFVSYCMKFRKDILNGFQVTQRTGFETDRKTHTRPTFSTAGCHFYLDLHILVYINLNMTFVNIV